MFRHQSMGIAKPVEAHSPPQGPRSHVVSCHVKYLGYARMAKDSTIVLNNKNANVHAWYI